MLTMCSFIHPSHLDEGWFSFVVYWCIIGVLVLVYLWRVLLLCTNTLSLIYLYLSKKMQKVSTNTKKDLRQGDKAEVDVKWSECVWASTAALWYLMLFKSGLRKSQSCCWQSLFSAPGVSIAPGHETHRIYAGDKEGGFHNAWWSASDTLPQSDLCVSGWGKICEETL